MDIILNGLAIKYTDNEFEDVLKLKCDCGHELWKHAFYDAHSLSMINTGQCLYCGVKGKQYICKQFEVYPDDR